MAHHTPQTLQDELRSLNIAFTLYEHVPVFTVEEAEAVSANQPGAHIKNLFVRDKAGAFVLITALTSRRIDLNAMAKACGAAGNRWSFGSPEQLLEMLGVTPGSVTPLALINAKPNTIRFILDDGIFSENLVNPHPLINSATLGLAPTDLVKAIEHWGHAIEQMDLGKFARADAA
ncbi:MAG: prolyl-tRNA synthetase associated domain-containing protein [Pseudomonadota bacterium]|jgi:Ala-tRNA(Pro) deacylase